MKTKKLGVVAVLCIGLLISAYILLLTNPMMLGFAFVGIILVFADMQKNGKKSIGYQLFGDLFVVIKKLAED